MDDKKGNSAGSNTGRGYSAGEDKKERRYGPGETQGGRDLTEKERGQLLSGYTAGSEDETLSGLSAGADTTGASWGATGSGNSGGMSTLGAESPVGGMAASANSGRTGFSGSAGISASASAGTTGYGLGGAGELDTGESTRMDAAKDKVRQVASQGADRAAGVAKEKVDANKDAVADKLDDLSSRLHEQLSGKAEEYVQVVTSAADKYVSRASQLLRDKNSDELIALARDQVRERPLIAAAGFFALGFFGARLLRS